jgi:hypothetical protein
MKEMEKQNCIEFKTLFWSLILFVACHIKLLSPLINIRWNNSLVIWKVEYRAISKLWKNVKVIWNTNSKSVELVGWNDILLVLHISWIIADNADRNKHQCNTCNNFKTRRVPPTC